MRDALPTGTVTLLFTDIEGSTRLLQRVGERYADILEACRHLLRTAFHQYHGHVVDTQGDAFFVAFARATDAIRRSLPELPCGHGGRLGSRRVRCWCCACWSTGWRNIVCASS